MNRRQFIGLLGLVFVPSIGGTQPVRRVALVTIGDLRHAPLTSFVDGLRALGYEAGRNIELMPSAAQGSYARLEAAAREAVKRNPEVIVTDSSTATRAVKTATSTIPVVMVVGVDPVEHGFVKSLARPEGNITGVIHSGQALNVKRLEVLKETLPAARRIGVLWSAESAQQAASLKITEAAAKKLGITVVAVELKKVEDVEHAFKALSKARVDAFLPVPSAMLERAISQIVRLEVAHRIPGMYFRSTWPRHGGFMSYAASEGASYRTAAIMVDKILKGAKPADLPVEQPTKFELVVNLKAAKALGVEIPKSVLFRADEVIE